MGFIATALKILELKQKTVYQNDAAVKYITLQSHQPLSAQNPF